MQHPGADEYDGIDLGVLEPVIDLRVAEDQRFAGDQLMKSPKLFTGPSTVLVALSLDYQELCSSRLHLGDSNNIF